MKINYTVAELRKQGWKVGVFHNRDEIVIHHNGKTYLRRGRTTVRVTSPDQKHSMGQAECGINDVFRKRIGTKIALGRAMRNLGARRENFLNEQGRAKIVQISKLEKEMLDKVSNTK